MPIDTITPDAMHFRSLRLENVRAFGSSQCLELFDDEGATSHWNLILGENGVGKTTLMQALAVMRPTPGLEDKPSTELSADVGPPPLSRVELSAYENADIMRFIRRDATGTATMTAVLEIGDGTTLEVGVDISGNSKDLKGVEYRDADHPLKSEGPLILRYSAARHVGNDNLADLGEQNFKASIFSETVDLYDPEKILEALDYAAKTDSEGKEGIHSRRFETLKTAVASLLPDTTAEDIEFRGPRIAGRDPDRSGVYVLTPSGFMPLANLSLGYQEMFAWIVDLAWRLFNAYPASPEPLSESAIVLIDEVDLHLHPRWQRNLRRCLLGQFPNVQFIATTHNPVTAQEALSEGGNVAVVRWAGREAHILNRPIPRREWRYDQLLASDLFGFGSDSSQEAEAKLTERIELIRNTSRSPEQENRLRELDEFVASLPTARSPSAQSFEEFMMDFAKNFPHQAQR